MLDMKATATKKKTQDNPYNDMMSHPTGATYLGEGMYMTSDGSIATEEEVWGV